MSDQGLLQNPSSERKPPIRGRFAPTPTGPLHLGSLITAVGSYLETRHAHGFWHLRIDDLDLNRSKSEWISPILTTLETLGLEWEGPVVYQSQNHSEYQAALDQLKANGMLYACRCSRKTLAGRTSLTGEETRYPGTCQHLGFPFEPGESALRIKVSENPIEIQDGLQGAFRQNLSETLGDFVVYRKDQVFAYHLATVLDDEALGVTQVVRGFDLLDSTPRQVFLQEALGLKTPRYVHLPLLIDEHGTKISKSLGASAVSTQQPSETLHEVLGYLRQNPPIDLKKEPVETMLNWASEHWDLTPLKGIASMTLREAP